jgi:hypothetical protein
MSIHPTVIADDESLFVFENNRKKSSRHCLRWASWAFRQGLQMIGTRQVQIRLHPSVIADLSRLPTAYLAAAYYGTQREGIDTLHTIPYLCLDPILELLLLVSALHFSY